MFDARTSSTVLSTYGVCTNIRFYDDSSTQHQALQPPLERLLGDSKSTLSNEVIPHPLLNDLGHGNDCLTMLTIAFVLSFLIAIYFPKSLALTRLIGRNLLKFRGLKLKSTLLENILVEDVESVSTALPRRTIPVVNTAGLNISAANFFGRQVFSVDECRLELVGLLRGEIEIEEEFLHYRVEYLTKYLEYKYIPIQTIPFLNFALSGEWDILYSNAITPRADDSFSYKTFQEISANESEGGNGGILNNVIRWKLNRPDEQCSGDLVVSCQYQLNTKGDLDITLVEHLLIPQGDAPRDVEDLIMSVQKSVPFESFDPNDIRMQNTYIDPYVRISRITGEKFDNVVNICLKRPIKLTGKSPSKRGII